MTSLNLPLFSAGTVFGLLGRRAQRRGSYPIVLLATAAGLLSYALVFINLPNNAPFDKTDDKGMIKPR